MVPAADDFTSILLCFPGQHFLLFSTSANSTRPSSNCPPHCLLFPLSWQCHSLFLLNRHPYFHPHLSLPPSLLGEGRDYGFFLLKPTPHQHQSSSSSPSTSGGGGGSGHPLTPFLSSLLKPSHQHLNMPKFPPS